jgi:hypothetical protein
MNRAEVAPANLRNSLRFKISPVILRRFVNEAIFMTS